MSAVLTAYTIFTNEQLAQMVQLRCMNKSELEKVPGVGDGRIGKYGDRFLEVLTVTGDSADETGGKSF